MELLQGKHAVVTGAGRGIGKAIAEEFYRQGADVLLTDIDEQLGQDAVQQIRTDRENKILFRKMDVTSPEQIDQAIQLALSEFGRLDTWVNNAAVLIAHPVIDFPLEDWQKVFKVNMEGAFLCSKAAVRSMIEQGVKGSVLNIASASSRKADAEHAAYSSSKAAVIEFARVLALEVGAYGIRVNSILPGATETEMLTDVFAKVEGLKERIVKQTVLGKLGQPQDQANAAIFLCSDMASHITGEYLVVSGGEFFNA